MQNHVYDKKFYIALHVTKCVLLHFFELHSRVEYFMKNADPTNYYNLPSGRPFNYADITHVTLNLLRLNLQLYRVSVVFWVTDFQ